MADSDEAVRRILRHLLTNLTSGIITTETAQHLSQGARIYQGNLVPVPSPSPPTMVAGAISDSVTIPTNPSMALTSPAVTSTAKPDQHVYNSTGYLVEQDELEYSILAAFSDMQTVFLACFATLVPLIVAVAIVFGVRHAWRKYRHRRNGSDLPWYRGVCSRGDTPDSLHHRPHSGSITIQPATRILSAQDLVNGLDGPRYICETEVMDEVALAASNHEYASPGNHTSKNANGNIITLTLKNNHLIVETEERAVTMEDNSFVVEVQPKYIRDEVELHTGSTDDVTSGVTDQQALVHREEIPEDRSSEFGTKLFGSTNTGLSQSDLSISSQGSLNRGYRYGNQVEYESGQFGHTLYGNNYQTDVPPHKPDGCKWVEFDKSPDTEKTLLNDTKTSSFDKEPDYDKRNNIDTSLDSGSSLEHQDSTDASNSTDTVRSNPNLQVNGATPNKLEGMERKGLINDYKLDSSKPVITGALLKDEGIDENCHDNKRKLGNGTLSPEHRNSKSREQKPEGSVFVPCHKRTSSIPPRLIEDGLEIDRKKGIDIYSQIKTSILPGLSPKFEILQNDVSPIDEKES
ncbi:uncharacterized protein LOC107042895 [Diachasma alloeum]|uniref:uncharacterized protein LOC107042895 n=1 Tax=Diachasma alloeum TaxID=454923 RepID=UPI000738413F|nr:uncharacterized protein LOC107042895 [Diachasma alloeum]